jgi:hypothetical protein
MACLLQGLVHASMKDKETHDETLELVEHLRQSIAQADIERKKFVDEAVEANVRAHEAEKAAQADREVTRSFFAMCQNLWIGLDPGGDGRRPQEPGGSLAETPRPR